MCCGSSINGLPFILLTQNVLETVALSFHLIEEVAEKVLNAATFTYLSDVHEGAHKIQPLMRSFCLINDIVLMIKGDYFKKNQSSIGLYIIELVAKICHTVSHLFSVLSGINDLKIINLSMIKPILQCDLVLNVVGCALWTVSLIWKTIQASREGELRKNQEDDNKTPIGTAINFAIYGGGFLASSLFLAKKWNVLKDHKKGLGLAGSAFGVVSSACSVYRITQAMKEHKHDHKIILVN